MKIGQLAEATSVSTSRIRFYEKHGLIPPPSRLDNGYRDYHEETISRLRTITMSKALGYTLSEIRRILPDDPSDLIARSDVMANLDTKLADIDRQIVNLKAMRGKVQKMITYFADPNSANC